MDFSMAARDQAELDLVILAIRSHQTSGCCEWEEREARRVRQQGLPIPNLTPDGVRRLLIDYVVNRNGVIEQREEKRSQYGHREFWYRAVIPVPELPRGLFVEIVMDDPDPDCPAVLIV